MSAARVAQFPPRPVTLEPLQSEPGALHAFPLGHLCAGAPWHALLDAEPLVNVEHGSFTEVSPARRATEPPHPVRERPLPLWAVPALDRRSAPSLARALTREALAASDPERAREALDALAALTSPLRLSPGTLERLAALAAL